MGGEETAWRGAAAIPARVYAAQWWRSWRIETVSRRPTASVHPPAESGEGEGARDLSALRLGGGGACHGMWRAVAGVDGSRR